MPPNRPLPSISDVYQQVLQETARLSHEPYINDHQLSRRVNKGYSKLIRWANDRNRYDPDVPWLTLIKTCCMPELKRLLSQSMASILHYIKAIMAEMPTWRLRSLLSTRIQRDNLRNARQFVSYVRSTIRLDILVEHQLYLKRKEADYWLKMELRGALYNQDRFQDFVNQISDGLRSKLPDQCSERPTEVPELLLDEVSQKHLANSERASELHNGGTNIQQSHSTAHDATYSTLPATYRPEYPFVQIRHDYAAMMQNVANTQDLVARLERSMSESANSRTSGLVAVIEGKVGYVYRFVAHGVSALEKPTCNGHVDFGQVCGPTHKAKR